MELVKDKEEILDNVELFLEGLELGTEQEIKKSIQLIKKSTTFLVVITDEVTFFVPSTFIGFQENNISNFSGKLMENQTNTVISQLLGSTPKIDKTLDELFLDFCDEVEINRSDVGISRDYWILKNI
ncbi:hypothetical protein SAMN05421738_11224 [Algoriella xinjiangensis]|uniref:Uncharacterized protein n=1 Tax=Algoriella xinjiangensis TaxID=684065 RepID=A0A1I4YWA7_9FLAO|nr:hypothetical protein [Algoriella xinjiangensis]SFN42305.1 hypothetical protein SAMN05421738_11224 [Algoriella xinjiangensis]VDH16661.1 Uncharacterised protein [Algoriella xinjiangensis]